MLKLISIILLFSVLADARVRIPTNLDKEDRQKTLEVLGFSTSSKLLTDPYPLGGFAGFEFGLEHHTITVDELAPLGNTVPEQEFFSYSTISIGKGLYNNFDIFFHFMPYSEGTGISEYGAIIRWGFYQLAYYPVSFSLTAHANSTNINDVLNTRSTGLDFTTGITAQNIFFYLGSGWATTKGSFLGGPTGIIETSSTDAKKSESLEDVRYFLATGFRVSYVFTVFSLDVFHDPTYSAKIGFRY